MSETMTAAYLPGNSTVEMRNVPVPAPGHGEVLLRVKASTICGSDIRCIYHEHLGKGPEGYQGVIAGHEPCGPNRGNRTGLPPIQSGRSRDCLSHLRLRRLQRLPARLHDLLHQREISPGLWLAARWRMADYMIAEEKDLIQLPDDSPMPMAHRWPAASGPYTKVWTRSASAATTRC